MSLHIHAIPQTVNHSLTQSINQSVSQSINRSSDHSITHSLNQSINQSITQTNEQTNKLIARACACKCLLIKGIPKPKASRCKPKDSEQCRGSMVHSSPALGPPRTLRVGALLLSLSLSDVSAATLANFKKASLLLSAVAGPCHYYFDDDYCSCCHCQFQQYYESDVDYT